MRSTRARRWRIWIGVLLVAGAVLAPPAARAEATPMRLSVRRVNGADLLGRVAGTFRLTVDAPDDTRVVTFYLDGQVVGRATGFPFTSVFDTGDYPLGEHHLEAVVRLADGSVATSNSVSLDFRSRNWHLAVRQSMFLCAGLVLLLGVAGGVVVHRLLRIQPRLALLDR